MLKALDLRDTLVYGTQRCGCEAAPVQAEPSVTWKSTGASRCNSQATETHQTGIVRPSQSSLAQNAMASVERFVGHKSRSGKTNISLRHRPNHHLAGEVLEETNPAADGSCLEPYINVIERESSEANERHSGCRMADSRRGNAPSAPTLLP